MRKILAQEIGLLVGDLGKMTRPMLSGLQRITPLQNRETPYTAGVRG
jgi:hypothetical protein